MIILWGYYHSYIHESGLRDIDKKLNVLYSDDGSHIHINRVDDMVPPMLQQLEDTG